MQIGAFTLSNDGGWTGPIRTLTIDAKVRLVPNDDRTHDNAPASRVRLDDPSPSPPPCSPPGRGTGRSSSGTGGGRDELP